MTFEDFTKNLSVKAIKISTGTYIIQIIGISPDEEFVNFELWVEECFTPQVLQDTIQSSLEEIFDARYHYSYEETENTLLFDGGIFK